jgi:hypothetical protein
MHKPLISKRTLKKLLAVAQVLYTNRKAELALALGIASIVREIVQAATGH